MDVDQVLLSDDLLAVMRAAVAYAVDYGASFVAPPHVLLALLDDPRIHEAIGEHIERGRVIAAARQPAPAGLIEAKEGPLPRGERAPFIRYNTLVFQSTDGAHQRWLNRETFRIFNEAAKRVERGRFLPRHLVLGFAIGAQEERDVRTLLGRDPELFKEIAFRMT